MIYDFIYFLKDINYASLKQANLFTSLLKRNGYSSIIVKYENIIKNKYTTNYLITDCLEINNINEKKITYKKLIFRKRGLSAEEMKIRHPLLGHLYYPYMWRKEKNDLSFFDYICFVSKEMLEYYKVFYKIPEEKCFFIPNVSGEIDMENFFQKRNISSICYSGGLSKWQKIPEITSLFKVLNRNKISTFAYIPKKYFLSAKKLFDMNTEVFSLKESELKKALGEINAGIILRDSHIINKVASPFKIWDYLDAGLKVILTEHVGFWSEFSKKIPSVFLKLNFEKFSSENMISKIKEFLEMKVLETDIRSFNTQITHLIKKSLDQIQ